VPVAPAEKRDATPVRGVPVASPTPPAVRQPALGVTIKGAKPSVPSTQQPTPLPSKDTPHATPDALAAFTLPPGIEPGTEEADLESAMHLLRRKQWSEARRTRHALAARNGKEKRYRALLSYARGREAQDANRRDEARTEFARALQLDPDLGPAKAALAQVTDAEPPERPSGGLLSRLFKK
jgi:hypothetical protein